MENLLVSTLMVSLTAFVHFLGIAAIIRGTRSSRFTHQTQGHLLRQGVSAMIAVLGLFFLHSLEIWMYAALYLILGEFQNLETALYFSATTFTTVGFGDVKLDETWRLTAAIESANGFLLIGWSTAFLVSITARMRVTEHIGEHPADN